MQEQKKVTTRKATKGKDTEATATLEIPEVEDVVKESEQIEKEAEEPKQRGCGCGW
jgi:hypothetical protein